MRHLSKTALQHLLLDRMKHNKAKTFTMLTLQMFYHHIITDRERCNLYRITNETFETYIHEFMATPNSWIAMRHDKDNTEIFYLTVKLCPMDKSKINRILCGWLNREHRCN